MFKFNPASFTERLLRRYSQFSKERIRYFKSLFKRKPLSEALKQKTVKNAIASVKSDISLGNVEKALGQCKRAFKYAASCENSEFRVAKVQEVFCYVSNLMIKNALDNAVNKDQFFKNVTNFRDEIRSFAEENDIDLPENTAQHIRDLHGVGGSISNRTLRAPKAA